MDFNVDVANQVSAELRKRGFEAKQTDANANDDKTITSQDWDLFLAIHYDADIYGKGGFFADFPEPSTDGATSESQRICGVLTEEYGKVTGIVNRPERSNDKTRYYYMWKYLSPKTPCVLIECGVGMHVPDDWQILHHERSKVVEGLTRAICKAFGVPYSTEESENKGENQGENQEILKNLQEKVEKLERQIQSFLTNEEEWQRQLKAANQTISNLTENNAELDQKIVDLTKERANYKKWYEEALSKSAGKLTELELVWTILSKLKKRFINLKELFVRSKGGEK